MPDASTHNMDQQTALLQRAWILCCLCKVILVCVTRVLVVLTIAVHGLPTNGACMHVYCEGTGTGCKICSPARTCQPLRESVAAAARSPLGEPVFDL
jgi:hypothetical protein